MWAPAPSRSRNSLTADYTAALASGANPTQNVRITATPAALAGNTQINSLTLNQASATTVDIGVGNTLRSRAAAWR